MSILSKGRILLAEDDPALRRSYVRMLKHEGFEVEDVEDGASATWRLRSEHFDALVSDISMPGVDGMELLKLAREVDEDLPVVLMTAQPTVGTAIGALERRVLRYLIKPFAAEELAGALKEAVRLRKLAAMRRQTETLLREEERTASITVNAFAKALDMMWMAFQPIVSWQQRKVSAYEALVRSDSEMKNPAVLLATAEKLGRVHDLGRRVRRHVATRIAGSGSDLEFFVNLHPQDLVDDDLYEPTAPLSVVANRVILEVTERASLEEIRDLKERLTRLRQLGYRLALDDLGAGYAGLTSFLELRPEVVKFDMLLIRNLHQDPTRRTLVANMFALCRDLGCQVVAEGVETVDERNVLAELGFDLMQGYHFAKPARVPELVTWSRADLAAAG